MKKNECRKNAPGSAEHRYRLMRRRTLRTTRYQIPLRKEEVPSGKFRFAFFTDLHNCCGREEAERLLSALEAGKPDFVLCGGDSIVAKPGRPTAPAVAFLQEVGRRFPLYCGTGNHEYRARIYPDTYQDMYREFTEPLRKSGVTILENSTVSFLCRDIPVQILGFDLDRYYYRRLHHSILPEGELDRALGRPDSRAVTILLAHNPLMLQTYLSWKADMTLCGHYHGGVMRFGAHHGLISPDFRLFPGDAYGLFQQEGKYCIVSSGCGEHSIPVRIHNPREFVVADLTVSR